MEDGKLVITSPELVMSIDVVSGKDDEIVVQYTSPSQSYTSLITYKKIGGKDIAAKDVIGEWKANKVIVTNGGDTTITDENTIKKVLDGLDWIKLTNNTLVLMDTGISYSYSISNNELVTSPTGELQGRVIFYIVEKNDVVVYYSSHSYSGYIVYGRV